MITLDSLERTEQSELQILVEASNLLQSVLQTPQPLNQDLQQKTQQVKMSNTLKKNFHFITQIK